ncbi:MAG: hypothetical protein KQI81_08880 [Deltaproteobacteria bacterium]|nr:hypothetical protein [Deltaproteobacteria bacterium]
MSYLQSKQFVSDVYDGEGTIGHEPVTVTLPDWMETLREDTFICRRCQQEAPVETMQDGLICNPCSVALDRELDGVVDGTLNVPDGYKCPACGTYLGLDFPNRWIVYCETCDESYDFDMLVRVGNPEPKHDPSFERMMDERRLATWHEYGLEAVAPSMGQFIEFTDQERIASMRELEHIWSTREPSPNKATDIIQAIANAVMRKAIRSVTQQLTAEDQYAEWHRINAIPAGKRTPEERAFYIDPKNIPVDPQANDQPSSHYDYPF